MCGTDHDLYACRPGSAAAVPPIVLGHENSGVMAAIGAGVTGVKVGDRVAVDPTTAWPSTRTSTAASANTA